MQLCKFRAKIFAFRQATAMARSKKKANYEREASDYECALTELLKDEVVDPVGLEIRLTCAYRGACVLISEPKSLLWQASTEKEDEALALKYHEVGSVRNLSICAFRHLASKATAPLRGNNAAPESFVTPRVSAIHRKLG